MISNLLRLLRSHRLTCRFGQRFGFFAVGGKETRSRGSETIQRFFGRKYEKTGLSQNKFSKDPFCFARPESKKNLKNTAKRDDFYPGVCYNVPELNASEGIMLSFRNGLKDGIPICLGYFSVSFAFGILTSQSGIPVYLATLMSATNLTSAGQFAGVGIIAACGTIIELIVTTLIINARYFLMSFSLTQKLDETVSLPARLAIAFGVTDEIFAVSIEKHDPLTFRYMAGLILLPLLGWTGGTFFGATASQLLPLMVQSALNILLYGMFVAIIVPPAHRSRPVAIAVISSMVLSAVIFYLLRFISAGWTIIICAVSVSAFMAWRFPVEQEKEGEAE